MASLKEVKTHINSVSSTRKITSAMKLVASSKLHKAQAAIQGMRPYQSRLNRIMSAFANEIDSTISPYMVERKVRHAVVVCLSSNSSLCGAFNANVIRDTLSTISSLQKQGVETIDVIPVGQKIADKMKKEGYSFASSNSKLLEHPRYQDISNLASQLMERFRNKEIDQVILIYNHFKSTASQVVVREQFLPIVLTAETSDKANNNSNQNITEDSVSSDYIIEPSKEALVEALIPNVLMLNMFTAVLDSLAAEHSARVVAMQTATDNADELLHDLTLTYNKTRQAAITSELSDIVGASFQ